MYNIEEWWYRPQFYYLSAESLEKALISCNSLKNYCIHIMFKDAIRMREFCQSVKEKMEDCNIKIIHTDECESYAKYVFANGSKIIVSTGSMRHEYTYNMVVLDTYITSNDTSSTIKYSNVEAYKQENFNTDDGDALQCFLDGFRIVK